MIFMVGATKGLVVVLALIIVSVAFVHPMTGLTIAVFANTSLQVLGSSHIIGAPASLSKIFGAVTVGALILHMAYAKWKITASPIYIPILAFLVVVFAWDTQVANPETGFFEGTIRLFLMILLCTTVATFAGQSQRKLDQTVLAFIFAISLTGIIGLAEHFLPSLALKSDDPRLAQGAIGGIIDAESLTGVVIKRITGGIGDANWLSYTIAMAVPLLIYGWHRWTSFWSRSLILSLGGLQLIALVLSYTRTGFMGLAVAFVYLLLRRVLPLRPVMAIIVMGLAMSMVYLPPGFMDRMFSSKYLKEGSTPIRRLYFEYAVEIWKDQPVFGYGYKGFGINFYNRVMATSPDSHRLAWWQDDLENSVVDGRELVSNIGAHNLELELLIEYGLLGAFLYFSIFWVAFSEMRKVMVRGPPHLRILAIAISAGLLAFLTCGFLGHAKYLKFLWLLFGLAMAVRRVSLVGDSPTRSLFEGMIGR